MVSRGGGKIINIASIAGKTPLPGMGIYCVTKAAVLMLTEVLAAELAADNIQVNAVVPGFVRTRFSQVLWDNLQIYETIIKNIPQGRMADPKEIASAVLFLSSPASTFTTGAALVVDGGQLIGHKI
jgi:NAD(P)-dependent dehydrogenase (short-subunit alcohol dehydrogenase family)